VFLEKLEDYAKYLLDINFHFKVFTKFVVVVAIEVLVVLVVILLVLVGSTKLLLLL